MQTAVQQCRPLHDNNTISRSKTIETPAGTLVLRDFCSPSLVESLRAEGGLRAFARLPEREHQLLLNIARRTDSALTLPHTLPGEIIRKGTRAPPESWWEACGR